MSNASFSPGQIYNCTIGRIVRLFTNNDDKKEEEMSKSEPVLAGVHVRKLKVESGGIGINYGSVSMNRRGPTPPRTDNEDDGIAINLGHAVVNGKKVPNQFFNCAVDDVILKSPRT